MLDLTGEHLTAFLLRELKDVVNRNPRFRRLGGEAFVATPTLMAWNDLQVEITTTSSSGNRLSPDYFICTQHGHAILAKLENKNGAFVEWVRELRNQTDDSGQVLTYPLPGIYYLQVDSVDEATKNVGLTMAVYRWNSGRVANTVGSMIYFAQGIDSSQVTPVDPSILYKYMGGALCILSYTTQLPLQLKSPVGNLTPMTDYWYQAVEAVEITASTQTGHQDLDLPVSDYISMYIQDDTGYVLRPGVDFEFVGATRIRLSQWTPPGATLTGFFTVKANPTTTSVVALENKLGILPLQSGEEFAVGQVNLVSTYGATYTESDLVVAGDGTVWLKNLLQPGEVLTWEVRILAGQSQVVGQKYSNNAQIVPGLMIGIGDQVEVGDQVAILVSPDLTETYEVYGSKENVTFNINVRANDRLTASEVAAAIKAYLLVESRDRLESSGVTIFEIAKATGVEPKGNDGVATSTSISLTVSAAADWEYYKPLTLRISYISVDVDETVPGWGRTSVLPRISSAGGAQFLPYYA